MPSSSGLPPNKPTVSQAAAKAEAAAAEKKKQEQANKAAQQRAQAPKETPAKAPKDGMFSRAAVDASFATVAGQIKKSGTAATADIIKAAIADAHNKPHFGLNESTFAGLAKMARDYNSKSASANSLIETEDLDTDDDGVSDEYDEVIAAIRAAQVGA